MKLGSLGIVILIGACQSPPPAAEPKPGRAPTAPVAPVTSTTTATAVPDYVQAAVDAPERSADDRKLDGGRKPRELLAFAGISPGQRVAELGAGGGYTTELLARVVGANGKVYAQNNKLILERFAEKPLSERLSRPGLENVVRVDREFDDPLPPEATALDAVLCVLFYHDTVWMNVKRDAMNLAVYRALKPGGAYVIVDHSARRGAGLADVQTLHRIEQSVVESEVEQAGFHLAKSADFLRNPDDPRDWNASPKAAGERRGTSDRFVLVFEKPH
jgi:predicted methyltransferase